MKRMLFTRVALCCILWAGVAQEALGTLEGRITRGPLTPVERLGIPNSAPVARARLGIATPTRQKITTVESNSEGEYSVQLAPGTYLVTVISPAGAFNRPNPPLTVTVKANKPTHLDIRLDTGIR
jgi:Carboxypeptidase regulatory-like domain